MTSFAVIKSGGKQYLVKDEQEIIVQRLNPQEGETEVKMDVVLRFNDDSDEIELGTPTVSKQAKGTVIENLKGKKVRVSKFKSKVRYRRITGFRPQLTKLKINL